MLDGLPQNRQKGPPSEYLDMSQRDRRRYVRLQRHFPAKVFKLGLDSPVHGVTVNLSPVGAFIKTTDYRAFQAEDQTTITLFLPAAFSGKDHVTALRGTARIIRTDHQNEGIAVEFDKSLKQFVKIVQEK